MSLIQEALRRRDEDSGDGPMPPRIIPPPIPKPQAPSPKAQPPSMRFLAGAMAVLTVALLAAAGSAYFFLQRPIQMAALTASAPSVTPPPGSSEPAAITVAAPDKPAIPPVIDLPAPALVAEPMVPTVAPPPPKVEPDAQVEPVPAAPAPQAAPAPPPAGGTEPVGLVVTLPVPSRWKEAFVKNRTKAPEWPRLRVVGVMARSDPLDSAAILDGDMVAVGDEARGVHVLDVRPNGALFSYQGQTQFVRVGQSTR
jgi:general secretion pathway protein B